MPHQTFSMRLDSDLLARIDHNAEQAGQTRTAYVLGWLPETYETGTPSTETPEQDSSSSHR